jgi:hypothetical protein
VKAPRHAQLDTILIIPTSVLPDKASRPTRPTALLYKNYGLTEKLVPSKDAKTTHRISPIGCIEETEQFSFLLSKNLPF